MIRREQYGLTLCGAGIVWFNLPVLPFIPLFGFVFGPWVLRWILKTRYVRFLRRYHYLHHRYPNCNFHLLVEGDFVLGRSRVPMEQDWDGDASAWAVRNGD